MNKFWIYCVSKKINNNNNNERIKFFENLSNQYNNSIINFINSFPNYFNSYDVLFLYSSENKIIISPIYKEINIINNTKIIYSTNQHLIYNNNNNNNNKLINISINQIIQLNYNDIYNRKEFLEVIEILSIVNGDIIQGYELIEYDSKRNIIIIKSETIQIINNCSSSSNLIINQNQNQRSSGELFKSVWNNIYLKSIILKYLKIYNLFYIKRSFETVCSYSTFKNKEYLYEIEFKKKIHKNDLIIEKLNTSELILENIESIKILSNDFKIIGNPYWLKSLRIPLNLDLNTLLLLKRTVHLEKLIFDRNSCINSKDLKNCQIPINSLPKSLKNFQIKEYGCFIQNGVLPNGLETLYIEMVHFYGEEENSNNLKQVKIFENGSLPMSLTDLTINCNKSNIIGEDLSKLKNLKSLKLNQKKIWYKENMDFKLPESLFDLAISISSKKSTLEKDENNNWFFGQLLNCKKLKKLHLIYLLNKDEEFNLNECLPKSLENLILKTSFGKQIYNLNQPLPKNIKTFESSCDEKLTTSKGIPILPEGLEILHFCYYMDTRPGGFKVNGFNRELLENQLPSTIRCLIFGNLVSKFDNGGFPLTSAKIFPTSLTYLDLGNLFNQIICMDVLPKKLKTLILGIRFNQPLNFNVLPSSLELLEIQNSSYGYPLKPKPISDFENLYIKLSNPKIYKYIPNLKSVFINTSINKPFTSIQFQNINKIEYIELDVFLGPSFTFNHLSKNNNIKTLQINSGFNQIIDLEIFNKLETLIINGDANPNIQISNNQLNNLKNILIKTTDTKFLDNVQSIFYPIINIIK